LLYPPPSITLVQASPNNILSDEQALDFLIIKAFSFQPPMESFTAELSSIYIEENILTKIKLNSLI
jgi:hypothetical protein